MIKYLLVLVLLFTLLLSIPPISTAIAGNNVKLKTLILTIDRAKFSSRAVEALGGLVDYIADSAPIAIIKIPAHVTDKITRLPGVLHVSEDAVVHVYKKPSTPPGKGKGGGEITQPPETLPWGIDYIDAEKVWNTTKGFIDVDNDGDSEIEVAVIDTGIDVDHPDLARNLKFCATVLSRGINQRITIGKCDDDNGHGTHVAGIIAALNNTIGVVGVAPTVELYIIKAFSRTGSGYVSDIIKAIDLAIKGPDGVIDSDGDSVIVSDPSDDAPEVISMSFGSDTDVEELHMMLQEAYRWNITLVAAAGNEGSLTPSYPAAYSEVIAVGAIDENGSVPQWSNRNPEVTAPGVDIYSTYPDDSYATLSGTSMACPHASGTVALIQAARLVNGLPLLPPGNMSDKNSLTVRGILHITATDKGNEGYEALHGYGVINAYEAVTQALSNQ